MSVALWTSRLAADHPLAVAVVAAGLGVGLVHRRPSLLHLQEQRVGTSPALQEHQIDLHPHAAHPHDLADHIDLGEAVEQAPPVFLEGQPVPGQEVVHEVRLFFVTDRDTKRGLLGYPGAPVRHHRELGKRPAACAARPLLLNVDRNPPAVGRPEGADQAVDVHAVVPDVELRHRRVPAHAPAVGLHARGHRRIGPRRFDLVLPRRDHETGGEALDVPLEGAGEGLVEVAQVE